MNQEALTLLQKMIDEAQAIIDKEDPVVSIRVGDETINARGSLAYTVIHTGYNNIVNQTPWKKQGKQLIRYESNKRFFRDIRSYAAMALYRKRFAHCQRDDRLNFITTDFGVGLVRVDNDYDGYRRMIESILFHRPVDIHL